MSFAFWRNIRRMKFTGKNSGEIASFICKYLRPTTLVCAWDSRLNVMAVIITKDSEEQITYHFQPKTTLIIKNEILYLKG